MMHACHLISSSVHDDIALPCEPVDGVCAVTGTLGPCLPRELVVSSSNCDIYLFAAPTSRQVHVDVWRAWKYGVTKPGSKGASYPERQSCWWCDGRTFCTMTKPEMRKIVLNGSPSSPWSMWVTTSYKKHGSVRSPVNMASRGTVAFDDLTVVCSDEKVVSETWARLRGAQDAGIPRPLIERLDIAPGYMAKIGWQVWHEFEQWARPRMRAPLYQFMTYLLPSQEELRHAAK